MAQRITPLVTEEIYHLFNRSIARQPIFTNWKDTNRFLESIEFYKFSDLQLRFSHYNRLQHDQKKLYYENLYKSNKSLATIYVFSIMPNHFHLLVKQKQENGIKRFMSQLQNSYARYYNTKYERIGALFQEMFKAVRIETDEQFIHVARYIHLNPLTSFVIKKAHELENYQWTSFTDYMGKRNLPFIDKDELLTFYKNLQGFRTFTLNQIDYQRSLKEIEHLSFK